MRRCAGAISAGAGVHKTPFAITIAEVIGRVVRLDEAEITVNSVVRAGDLMLATLWSERALTEANCPLAKRAISSN